MELPPSTLRHLARYRMWTSLPIGALCLWKVPCRLNQYRLRIRPAPTCQTIAEARLRRPEHLSKQACVAEQAPAEPEGHPPHPSVALKSAGCREEEKSTSSDAHSPLVFSLFVQPVPGVCKRVPRVFWRPVGILAPGAALKRVHSGNDERPLGPIGRGPTGRHSEPLSEWCAEDQ